MFDTACTWIGWLLLALGVAGCFLPVLPGPPIAYAALFVAFLRGEHTSPTIACLVVAGIATALATILDYVVPAMGAKRFDCSRAGTWGCVIGTIAGMFFLPIGVIAGPFLGAMAGELFAGKAIGESLRGAFGALLGFILGVVIKVACCGYIAYCYYHAVA